MPSYFAVTFKNIPSLYLKVCYLYSLVVFYIEIICLWKYVTHNTQRLTCKIYRGTGLQFYRGHCLSFMGLVNQLQQSVIWLCFAKTIGPMYFLNFFCIWLPKNWIFSAYNFQSMDVCFVENVVSYKLPFLGRLLQVHRVCITNDRVITFVYNA